MRLMLALTLLIPALFAGVGTFAPVAEGRAAPAAATPAPPLSAVAELGRKMFFDPALSASGRQSCASCHDPETAYAPDNARAVQLGGPGLDQPGNGM